MYEPAVLVARQQAERVPVHLAPIGVGIGSTCRRASVVDADKPMLTLAPAQRHEAVVVARVPDERRKQRFLVECLFEALRLAQREVEGLHGHLHSFSTRVDHVRSMVATWAFSPSPPARCAASCT